MKNQNIFQRNVLYAAVIGGVVLTSLSYFLSSTSMGASAANPKINLTFDPATGSYRTGSSQYATAILQTGSSTQKISAYTLVFKSTGPIVMTDASAPVALNGGALAANLVYKKVIPETKELQVTYALIAPVSSLPQGLSMKVYYYSNSPTSGKITIDNSRSQVTGPMASNVYVWGKVGSGSYSFTGSSPIPSPTSSMINCSTQCDANGDRCMTPATTGADWDDFFACYSDDTSKSYCYNRWDVDKTSRIDLVDFATCRKFCSCI